MDYENYQPEDFLMDESFRRWLLQNDPADREHWENWLKQHPEKAEVVNEARQLAGLIHFEQPALSLSDSQQMWETIVANRKEMAAPGRRIPLWARPFTAWQKVAAAASLLLLAGMAYFLIALNLQNSRYQTAYGETRTIVLPDSSVVTLNANSQLRFSSEWDPSVPREVWLEGEAFFSVRKKSVPMQSAPQLIKFTVHTRDLDVNVVGTEFNVNDRRGKTQVVLASGKVQLDIKSIRAVQPVFMQPGEVVEVSETEKRITKREANPRVYSSWKDNQFIFENTTLAEVATLIEDTYGLKVLFEDPTQSQRRIRGIIPREDIDILLAALSSTFNLNFRKDGGQIIIESQ